MDSDNGQVGQDNTQPTTAEMVETKHEAAPEPAAEPKSNGAGRKQAARGASLETLKLGEQRKGVVRNIVEFGAFIDIGAGRDGLAHVSTLKRAGIDKTLQVGDQIDVIVRRVDLDNNRISLTLPGENEGGEQETKTALKNLSVGDTVTGRVVRIVDFGAFVDIDAQTDGLLHISQLNSGFVRHPSEVVKVGDEVQVRILEIDTQKRRISLTMKEGEVEQVSYSSVDEEPESDVRIPTAFEVAFEQAQRDRKKRQRRSS